MSPRIMTRAQLALAIVLLFTIAAIVPLASATCLPRKKKLERKEEKSEKAESEKSGGSNGAAASISFGVVEKNHESKKQYSTGGLPTLAVGESIQKDASDDGASEKKHKSKSEASEDDEEEEKKKSKSKSSDEEEDDDDGKKKSKGKSSEEDDDDANKKSKSKSSDDDDDEPKKKSKTKNSDDDDEGDKKKPKRKSSDEEEEKKKSNGKSQSSDDDERKSKSKSQAADEITPKKAGSKAKAVNDVPPEKPAAAAAKPNEEDDSADGGKAPVPKKKHHPGTMSLPIPVPDLIAQPMMHALNPLVKMMCAKTDHAELCESSIGQLPEAPPAQLDGIGVLKLAMNALRAKVQEAINVATDRMGMPGTDALSKEAMDDCLQMYDDMKMNLDSAEAALKKGDKDTAHTMLDSARTDVDTCENGFSEREGLKPLMADLDKILADLSSNTLAIASAI